MREELSVVCPSCFESFEIVAPPPSEAPCQIDYDCEVCCRPMVISIEVEGGECSAVASGLGD